MSVRVHTVSNSSLGRSRHRTFTSVYPRSAQSSTATTGTPPPPARPSPSSSSPPSPSSSPRRTLRSARIIWWSRRCACATRAETTAARAAFLSRLLPRRTCRSRRLAVSSRPGSSMAPRVSASVTYTSAATRAPCVHTSDATMLHLRSVSTANISDRSPGRSLPTSSMVVCASTASGSTHPGRSGARKLSDPAPRDCSILSMTWPS
uniref:Uncharacterized protein n=1 Tax=Arundo donax TaxID=35708 RepID=A0A0A9E405_ARUDO